MDPAEALHTAARRYVIERAADWRDRYAALLAGEADGRRRAGIAPPTEYTYSDEALATFPRYQVLAAIQAAVEALTPSDFTSLEDARQRVAAAASADNLFTAQTGHIQHGAIEEERSLFAVYVAQLAEADLRCVEALPYRRTLAAVERTRLLQELERRWGVQGWPWYPLDRPGDAEPPPFTLVFEAEPFLEPAIQDRLRTALRGLGVSRVWELREGLTEADKEIDLSLLDAAYTGLEGIWLDRSFTWLVFASHEWTLTVTGERLGPALQEAWPDWPSFVWSRSA